MEHKNCNDEREKKQQKVKPKMNRNNDEYLNQLNVLRIG